MELSRALRLDQLASPPRLAFVGAGGKTTALFQCARQLPGPVLATATTHLALDQSKLADRHFYQDQLDDLEQGLPPGVTLVTGPVERGSHRTQGVAAEPLERLHALAERQRAPLLIEADGSRRLPLKAPAEHEPPIPGFVEGVVVVAGLSGLGRPLTPQWVHHPEIFAALSGLQPGEEITAQALARVLTHPRAGLKNIPPGARRIALLNQADTPALQAAGVGMAGALLADYDAILIGRLEGRKNESKVGASAPVSGASILAAHERVAAVILAAGESRRFGRPKQLLEWQGKALVWHVARRALQAGLNPVVVVCGAELEQIRLALADLPATAIYNPDWQEGQGSSVRVGAEAVAHSSGAILFLLVDQPQIPATLLRKLVEVHAQSLNPITGPLIDGQRANPVLFDRLTFGDLRSLSGERGGRQLFARYPVEWLPWHDVAALLDVDTPQDYQRLLEMPV